MVNMDAGIPGQHRAKPVTKKQLERLKKGAQKAELIKKIAEKKHAEERRQADLDLDQEMNNL